MGALVLASGGEFIPPGPQDLDLPQIFGPVTKPMLLVVLAMVIIAAYFLLASRNLKIVPSKSQFLAESAYDFGRNSIARQQIGSENFRPYIPLILTIFTFVLVNNLFGMIPFIQYPTMAHIGFPIALSVLVIYPVYHIAGIRRHGFFGYIKHQLVLPNIPTWVLPLLIIIEFFQKFVLNPLTLAIRVFAAMLAGHLIIAVFTIGGHFLLEQANWGLKGTSVLAFVIAIAMSLLEVFIQILQAYIFALLAAGFIGAAVASEH